MAWLIEKFAGLKGLSIAVALAVTTWGSSPPTSPTLPERVLPVPTAVSPQLQAILARAAPPSGNAPPKTAEDWQKLKAPPEYSEIRADAEWNAFVERHKVRVESASYGDVPCYIISPPQIAEANRDRALLLLHHGGFIWGGGKTNTHWAIQVATKLGYKVVVADYRLLPEHPAPAAIDDVVSVWKGLIKERDSRKIAVLGGSVGGGLVLSLVQRAESEGLPLPGAVVSLSPGAADLSKTGDS